MPEGRKKLLVVAVPPKIFGRFPPLLWRSTFDVSTPNNPRIAVKAASSTRFNLMITTYPLPAMDFLTFLDEVRGFGCPCRTSPLVVVTEPALVREASEYIGKGVNRVLSTDDPDFVLAEAVSQLLAVAPRVSVRLPIDLKTTVKRSDRLLMAQTVNVSTSGMLVTDPGSLRVGMRLTFRLDLPGVNGVVEGEGEVVRVTRKKSSAGTGAAFRFLGFENQGDEMLASFIRETLEGSKNG